MLTSLEITNSIGQPEKVDIKYVVSIRSRRISIRVPSGNTVEVVIPKGINPIQVKPFILSNNDWISKTVRKQKAIERSYKHMHSTNEQTLELTPTQIKKHLKERLDFLANQHGLRYTGLSIRNQKTRWGSCTHHNKINLNAGLVKLPQRLQDYVLLHELTHTLVKNHQKEFWDTLAKFLPNAKELDKELKRYKLELL
ncbi:MAG: M48 family metallopeptidase [Patescibacteria group bacterium]